MGYHRDELSIILQCTCAHWLYFIIANEQEALASGRAADFTVCCQDALRAFDLVLDTAEGVTNGSK